MTTRVSLDDYHSAIKNGGIIDLSGRAQFRLSGTDRIRYLNGQVTNDVSNIKDSETIYACVTNHKGKMDGDLYISSDGGQAFLMDAPGALRESLFLRLAKYIIADDAELEDVTGESRLVHLLGIGDPIEDVQAKQSNRFGEQGRDYRLPADSQFSSDLPMISPDTAELIRVDRGIPRWGAELRPEILPPEARLEARAISFTKGCYIGQEVISRIRSVGRVNRTLERLQWIEGEALEPGMILKRNEDEKEVGTVTSVAWHPDLEAWIALGFIKRVASAPETRLHVYSQNKLSSTVEVRKTPDHQVS